MQITVPTNIQYLTLSMQQIPAGNTYMYTKGFRNLIENHLTYLRNNFNSIVQLDPKKEQIFTGDFYNLLHYTQNVEQDLYWVIMRINGLNSPLEYSGNLGTLILPYRNIIEDLLNKYMNTTTMH